MSKYLRRHMSKLALVQSTINKCPDCVTMATGLHAYPTLLSSLTRPGLEFNINIKIFWHNNNTPTLLRETKTKQTVQTKP